MSDTASIDNGALAAGVLALAERVAAAPHRSAALDGICKSTVELLGCDRSSIFLLDGGYYRGKHNYGNPPDIVKFFDRHRVRLDDPLISRAIETRSFVLENRAADGELMNRDTARRARIRSIVIAPLFHPSENAIGFLTAEYNENPGTFTETMSTLVLGAASLAQIAIARDDDRLERERAETELLANERELRRLAAVLPIAAEQERQRIAAELHDTTLQELAGLAMALGQLEADYSGNGISGRLAAARQGLQVSIRTMREFLTEICSSILPDLGFAPAVEALCDGMEERYGYRVALALYGPLDAPDESATILLYQALRELMRNVGKHANAKCVRVEVRVEDEQVVVRVADDGAGFAVPDPIRVATSGGGFGLFSLQQRLLLGGGRLKIDSQEGRGTHVEVKYPLGTSSAVE